MTNNDILKKLRVALHLRNDDIIDILKLTGFEISATELGAFFRAEDHRNYRPCGDQVLRHFLDGLIIRMRGARAEGEGGVTTPANADAGSIPARRSEPAATPAGSHRAGQVPTPTPQAHPESAITGEAPQRQESAITAEPAQCPGSASSPDRRQRPWQKPTPETVARGPRTPRR